MKLGPHVASLGMRFYTGYQFPPEYRNNIFIAEHGSWNRSKKIGYRVARAARRRQPRAEARGVRRGLVARRIGLGPAELEVMPDGSLLVSDDHAGAIYRIAYLCFHILFPP